MSGQGSGLIAGVLSFAMLVACTSEQPAENKVPPERVVVYATYKDRTYLPALFNAFTKETGVIVTVRHGDAPGIVDDVIHSRVTPLADILLTPSVAEIWRSAEDGALRPIQSAVVLDSVPKWLRDPDGLWVALSYQSAVLVYDPATISIDVLSDYAALADSQFRRKVCLSSSSMPINRAVVAMLIDKLGVRDAELAVRGWVANLAMPSFDSEERLLRAVQAGDCAIGIVSSGAAALATQDNEDYDLQLFAPTASYSNIEGIGVARHARNPDGAIALMEWLLSEKIQTKHALHTLSYAANSAANSTSNIVLVAWHGEAARKLSERARYQ